MLNIINILETLKPDVEDIKQPPKKEADININTKLSLSLLERFKPELDIDDDKRINKSE